MCWIYEKNQPNKQVSTTVWKSLAAVISGFQGAAFKSLRHPDKLSFPPPLLQESLLADYIKKTKMVAIWSIHMNEHSTKIGDCEQPSSC